MKTFATVSIVMMLSLCWSYSPAASSTVGSVAEKTVNSVTGKNSNQEDSSSSPSSTKHPYEDRDVPDSLQGWVDYLVNFPLYKTGGEWIKLQGLLIALLIFVVGIWLVVLTGKLIKQALMRLRGLPEHISIAFSKVIVYFLTFFVLLGTVLVAGMPFSIVSILGAMILIGASLGAKSTIYDYLSGLVIAIEQPIRIHDCIELGAHSGFVDEIRGRYTRVRRFDGIDVLVPNSRFLEDEVINWTLSDSRMRGEFTIGVHYSSDIDKTMDILIQCMEENDEVLKKPTPSVLFWEFGDNALIFKLFFWIMAQNPLEIWSVESKLRRLSFNRLKDEGITVAFPQRDVHLDSSAPLKVVIDSHSAKDGTDERGESADRPKASPSSSEKRREESEEVAEPESSSKPDDDDGSNH